MRYRRKTTSGVSVALVHPPAPLPPGKPAGITTSLKCLYTNTHRMGKTRQNERSVCTMSLQLQRHGGTAHMTGTVSWMARKVRWENCPLCRRTPKMCMKVCLKEDDVWVQSLWVRLKGQTNKDDTIVSVCYRLPDQKKMDEFLHWQLEVASKSQVLVHLWGLEHLT